MVNLKKRFWIVGVLLSVLLTVGVLGTAFVSIGSANAANVDSLSVDSQKVYNITFDRRNFSGELNLNKYLDTITVSFYDQSKTKFISFEKTSKDEDNWTDNSDVTFAETNTIAYYYTITYKLKNISFNGLYYWQIDRGGVNDAPYYVYNGSKEATTELIATGITTDIDATYNVMKCVSYKPLNITVTKSYYAPLWYWDWDIEITNNNPFDVTIQYLNELCFEGDAKTFGGINDHKESFTLGANSTSDAKKITHNGTAGYLTVCMWISPIGADPESCGMVRYANELKYDDSKKENKGTCSQTDNTIWK